MSNASSKPRVFYKRDPFTTIAVVLVVFFLSQLLAGILISLYPAIKNWTEEQGSSWIEASIYAQFVYVFFAEVFSVWLILGLLKRAGIVKSRIGLVRPKLKDIAYALAGYGIYFIGYLAIVITASHFSSFIDVDQPQQLGFSSVAGGGQLAVVFLSLAVLPPIAEEIMFRGFLFSSLRAKFRLRYAVIITSILFGIAHLQFGSDAPLLWVAAIDTFVLSCVLCYLREKTGSLWASIMLHGLKNSIAFIVLFHSRF